MIQELVSAYAPMTYAEYLDQIERLGKCFGERYYPAERQAGIWDAVKHLSYSDFKRVVRDLIVRRKDAPLLDAILEAARPYADKIHAGAIAALEAELLNGAQCRWCGFAGLILSQLRASPTAADCAFRCAYCRAASVRGISRNIPAWASAYIFTYWPKYADGRLCDPDDFPSPREILTPVGLSEIIPAGPTPEEIASVEITKSLEQNSVTVQEELDL